MASGAAIGGIAAGAGAVASAFIGSKAARKAAEAQTEAAQAAAAESRRQFDITTESLRPFQEGGTAAFEQQSALSGALGPEAQAAAFEAFTASPEQAFLQEQGQRNLIRNQAAIGGIGGGNIRKALVQQGIGFASQDFANRFSRLGAISGAGLTAAGRLATAGAIESQQQGQFSLAGGAARAAGIQGQSQAFQTGLSGLSGILGKQSGVRVAEPSHSGLGSSASGGFG